MYNAANKPSSIILAVALSLSLISCGESESTQNAKKLLSEARTAISDGRYETALTLIDSISTAFPEDVDTRREAMALRPSVTEGLTISKLSQADSITTTLQTRYDSLARLMVKVVNPELVEGYWVAAQGRSKEPLSSDGIESRVTDNGEFYMISSLNPSSLRHHSFTITDKNGQSAATTTVAYDGELNYRVNGGEVVTYMAEACKEIGPFVLNHPNEALTVTFNGEGGYKKIKLTATQTAGLSTAWEFAEIMREFRHWSIERERLNRQLAIARDQKARLTPTTTSAGE